MHLSMLESILRTQVSKRRGLQLQASRRQADDTVGVSAGPGTSAQIEDLAAYRAAKTQKLRMFSLVFVRFQVPQTRLKILWMRSPVHNI